MDVIKKPMSEDADDEVLKTDDEEERLIQRPKDSSSSNLINFRLKFLLLVALVIQNSATALLARYIRSREKLFDINNFVLTGEICKFITCTLLEAASGNLTRNLKRHVLDRPWDAAKVAVPALLYLISNNLLFWAYSYLTAPVIQVTLEFKLMAAAILSVFVLGRRYSLKKWLCLITISIGVAMVIMGENGHKATREAVSVNIPLGLAFVFSACWVSAMSGVYFEKVLSAQAKERRN